MSKVAVLLLCSACSGPAWQNQPSQNQPRLERVGPSDARASGNLDGFLPLHRVPPQVTTTLPNGRRITVNAPVSKGKAYAFRGTGDPDPGAARPFIAALKRWRFAMHKDGTSPIRIAVTWEAQDGRFFVQDYAASVR